MPKQSLNPRPNSPPSILHLDSSGRVDSSVSRLLSQETVDRLDIAGDAHVTYRDLARGIPHINAEWIDAAQTDIEKRSRTQHASLKLSETLISEIQAADLLVIGVALYNFSIPSTFKAWIDHICRSRLTFQYVDGKPVGLLTGKKAIVIFSTGGTKIGSEIDFASAYVRHALEFVGIHDVHIAAADRLFADREAALSSARKSIAIAVERSQMLGLE